MIIMFNNLLLSIPCLGSSFIKEDLDIRRDDFFPCDKLTSTRGHNLKVNHGKPANLEIRRVLYGQVRSSPVRFSLFLS